MRFGSTWSVPWGTAPVFSETGAYLTWRVTPSKKEREQLEQKDQPVRERGELLVLATGERKDLGEVAELAFDPTGAYLAVRGPAEGEEETKVSDLHVHYLERGTSTVFGNVAQFSWHEELPLLAMIAASGGERGNAVQVHAPSEGRLVGLEHSRSEYRHLAWHEESADLAVLREQRDKSEEEETTSEEGDADSPESEEDGEAAAPTETKKQKGEDEDEWFDDTPFELVVFRSVLEQANAASPAVLTTDTAGLATHLYITGDEAPVWSPDGSRISFGVREQAQEPEPEAGAEPETRSATDDLPGVQIWHAADVESIPMQKARERSHRNRSMLAVWDLSRDRVVRVANDLEHDAQVLHSFAHALVEDETPYAWGNKFGRPYLDLWTVDLTTGERTRGLEKVRYAWPSVEGRYLLWFDGEHYGTLELATGVRTKITEGVDTTFANLESDLPNDGLEPPFGYGGWLLDDEAVLLYDQFDVWRVTPNGSSATRLTRGRSEEIVHRLIDLDEEEEAYSESDGLMFSLRDEWTEERGLARFDGSYRQLVLSDHSYRSVSKARHADTYLYRRESRAEPPALWLGDADLSEAEQVAGSNPFFSDYAWTRAELVEYQNAEGRRLHGTLLYPANHDPSRKYPMIVYAYEILAPSIHYWDPPNEKRYYNTTAWTQNGYFVFMPDIVFRGGDPGVSLAETLERALVAVDAKGLTDRSKVGFAGHSWGGYEATYLAARTNLFAATVAGAPLTDFVSFMGQFHWRPGLPETSHWETGQARMVVPYWEDPEGHERNSPLHGVHEMTTPILMAHGDDDGVVEFFQSTIFYNFARRAEKQMVLLVYEGEDHGLRVEENQIDYHRRILEWFGHYLKAEPAPAWITKGVRWQDHNQEKRRIAGSKD